MNKSGEIGVVCDVIGKGWISIRLFSNNSIIKGRRSDITVLDEDKKPISEANNPMMRKRVKMNKSGEIGVVCDVIGKGWISIRLFSNNSIIKGRRSDITVLDEDKKPISEAIQRASALLLV